MKPNTQTFHVFSAVCVCGSLTRLFTTVKCKRSNDTASVQLLALINRLPSKGKFGMCWSLMCMCATSLHCVFCMSLEEKRLLEFFSFICAHHDTLNCDQRRTQKKQHQTYVCVLLPSYQSIGRFFFLRRVFSFFFFCVCLSSKSVCVYFVVVLALCLLFRFHRYLWQLFLFSHLVCINPKSHYQHQIFCRIIIGYSAIQIYARYRCRVYQLYHCAYEQKNAGKKN